MPSGVNVPLSSQFARAGHDSTAVLDARPRAIDVHALFEDTVIAVASLRNPRSGRASRATHALFFVAAAALAIPMVSFVVAYVDAARTQRAWAAWDRAGHAHNAFVITREGYAIDIAVALCAVSGVVLLIIGALRRAHERTARDFTIGCARDAVVHAPAEQLPHASFPLVQSIGDDYALSFTPAMTGDITLADGRSATLAQLVASGAARVSHDFGDAWSWPIPRDARARLQLMHTTFIVASVDPPKAYEMAPVVDWQAQVYTAVTGLSVLLFLFVVNRIPESPRSLSIDPFLHETRFARFVIKPPDEPLTAIPDWLLAHANAGDKGLQKSRDTKAGAGERRKSVNPTAIAIDRRTAKQMAQAQANSAGVVGILKSYEGTHFASIGRDLPLGADADAVLDGLRADDVGAGGSSGDSLVASGKGAAGTGDSTIAGGALDTIGKGGSGGRSLYGRGAGGPLGSHRLAALPDAVPGTASVRGALDKEIVRRVVRRHLNEVKFCYEKGLLRQPSLTGRVTMQFTIAANGRVLAALVQNSTLNNSEVEACLRAAVNRWEFSQPNGGGIVIVSYPLVLKYADL